MRNKGGAATLLRQTRTKRWRCYRVNSIKWDYWQNVGAARDEYTTAKLALHSMSKRSNGYSRQLEHVDSLRNKFINRSVSFICRESRAERPRMWSAFYLSMLDLDKINQDDSHDYTNYLVMELPGARPRVGQRTNRRQQPPFSHATTSTSTSTWTPVLTWSDRASPDCGQS